MKKFKIITILITLNLVLFIAVSSFAKPFTNNEGDIINSGVKKQIEVVTKTFIEIVSSSENEFDHLRFDVNKFNTENDVVELPLNSLDYLRFDASNYSDESDITELPLMNEFDYLRFDVNNFDIESDWSEMPVNEFDYLRFDVNSYSNENSGDIDELPVN